MRMAVRHGHPLLPKLGKARVRNLPDVVGALWLYITAHDSADDIGSRSFITSGLPVRLPAVHCGSYFVALDLMASTDLVGVLPPALLRSRMQSGQLTELVLTQPLIPIQLGLRTRSGSLPTTPASSAAAAIIAISKRLAMTGELRSTSPLKV